MKIVNNNTITFDANDGIFLRQLVLTGMSAKSMKDGKGPVTKLGKEDYFFNNLKNMTFDLRTRRFQVTTQWEWFRTLFITRKVVAQVNVELGKAEAQVRAKAHPIMTEPDFVRANQIMQQQLQYVGVAQVEEYIQRQTGLTDEQMKIIREIFLPVLRDVIGWPV